jgi:ATP-dependent Clp protease ATP-binding subunit ClpX
MAASEDEGRDYNWDEDDIAASLIADDLIKFGLMPEFVGRLPIVSSVRQLDEAAMLRILTEPKNALVKQYQYLFKLDGVELTFTPEALKSIAQKAMINKTGARSLRGLIEKLLLPVMFEIPSSNEIASVTITAGVVDGTENPELINKKGHPVAWVDGKPALNTAA